MAAEPPARPRYSRTLPPRAVTYVRIRSLIDIAIVGVLLSAAILFLAPLSWRPALLGAVLALALLGLLIDVPLVDRLVVRNTTYEVDDDRVLISRGVLFHRDLALSTAQILTVTVVQGPLLRRFGFAKLALATLTESETLTPLPLAEADALRAQILAVFPERAAVAAEADADA